MWRVVRQSLAAASLLLFLATVGLWVRGYWVGDEVFLTTYSVVPLAVPNPYEVDESVLEWGERPEDRAVRKEREASDRERRRANCLYEVSTARGGICVWWRVSDLNYYTSAPEMGWTPYQAMELQYGGESGASRFEGKRWGFRRVDQPYSNGASGEARDASREIAILFPIWALAVCLAIMPFFWLKGVYHRQRRVARWRREGRCMWCGYDLRASAERCPECGRAIQVASPGSSHEISGRLPSWRRELLPLGSGALLLLVVTAAVYFPLHARVSAMERLHENDERLKAATEVAEAAIKDNDADALRKALAVGPIYGPKEIIRLIRERAGEKQYFELIRVLIENGADVRQLPGATLREATSNRNYALARLLVEKGANVNAPGELDDYPPLAGCLAWEEDSEALELFELLLEKGADPNGRTNPKSWTILHRLVHDGRLFSNRVRIAEMLIAKGADVNAMADGMTPLGMASDEADPLVQLLRAKGGRRESEVERPP